MASPSAENAAPNLKVRYSGVGCRTTSVPTPELSATSSFESEDNVVEAGLRLPQRFISVQVSGGAKPVDNQLGRLRAVALCVVHDPHSVTAAVQACRQPSGNAAGELCGFGEQINQRLLPAVGHG